MPVNKNSCDLEVKRIFASCHRTCSKSRAKVKKLGGHLNNFCDGNFFDPKKKYHICYNLCLHLKNNEGNIIVNKVEEILPQIKKNVLNLDNIHTSTCMNRTDRMEKRRREKEGQLNEETVKTIRLVKVKVNDEVQENFIDLDKMRVSKNENIYKSLEDMSKKYKLPFKDLKWRTKMERIDLVAKEIIAICMDRPSFNNKGLEYIHSNLSLAHDCLNVVHGIKDRLEKLLKMQLCGIEYPEPCSNEEEEEEEENLLMIPMMKICFLWERQFFMKQVAMVMIE